MATYYVSPLGNDAWTGLSATNGAGNGPFATLARAVEAMRDGGDADVAVVLDGTYELSAPLALTSGNSNDAIRAANGANPLISGGTAIASNTWTVGSDGIWKTQLDVSEVLQLVVDGERQTEARYPNEVPSDPIKGGWLWAKDPPSGHDPERELAYNKADFSAGQLAPGMKVTVFSAEGYSSDVLTITKVDTSAGIITFDQDASYEIGAGSRYFVSSGKVLLDKAGEWWFDKATQTLHFKPPVGFDGSGAVASGDLSLVTISGAQNITIEGLTFSDAATSAGTDDIETAAIDVASSSGLVIDSNTFLNVSQGVLLDGNSHHNTVSDNTFSHLWSIAVNLRPDTHENTITNNSISYSGEVFRTSGAIQIDESWGNVISHNLIQNVPRFGIAEVNWDDGSKSGGNLIEYNEILHSGQETFDVGAIYVVSHLDANALGDTIRYNIVVDAGGLGTTGSGFIAGDYLSNGIYLDDFASNANIYGNFIQDTSFSGILIHGGKNVDIWGNIIVDSAEYGVQLTDIDGRSMAGTKVHGNIIEISEGGENTIDLDPSMISPSSIYQNIYWSPGAKPDIGDMTFSAWQSMGGDSGSSVVANPGFVSTTNYALVAGSYALSKGFINLPWENMGLVDGGKNVGSSNGGTVYTWTSYTLGSSESNLVLLGSANVSGIGNAKANTIVGNSGNNLIAGKAGNDTLAGALGADAFLFDTAIKKNKNVDVVIDFQVGEDRIFLDVNIFRRLDEGKLAKSDFISKRKVKKEHDSDASILYDKKSGVLFYNKNGEKNDGCVKFANVDDDLGNIKAKDFLVLA